MPASPAKPKRKKAHTFRLVLVILLFLLQAGFLIGSLCYFNVFALSVYIVFQCISTYAAIRVTATAQNPSYKIAWISLLLAIPFFGLVFYLIWGGPRNPRKVKKRLPILAETRIPALPEHDSGAASEALSKDYPFQASVSRFLTLSGFPLYEDTGTCYYDLGDTFFPALLDSVRRAEKFIFLEFFIIAKGTMWDQLYAALCERAANGVEVRVLYDDLGSMTTLQKNFASELSRDHLEIAVFNKVKPFLSNFYINYRNHQKICIIDGKIGYTGGINIADEYVNRVEAFGHWKDSGIRLTGNGVWSMTVMFLQMWAYAKKGVPPDPDFSVYRPDSHPDAAKKQGFVQPVSDGPFHSGNNTMEYLYMHMINASRNYIYMTTPYLVPDNEMMTALCLAALRGVDVRILTPGIPDKKSVYALTRSAYGRLLRAGVRIFEYTPGFLHAKNVVYDGEAALVGTVNMDFRSFYMHFENAVWVCGAPVVPEIGADFLQMQALSREISYDTWKKRPLWYKVLQGILNIFAPML